MAWRKSAESTTGPIPSPSPSRCIFRRSAARTTETKSPGWRPLTISWCDELRSLTAREAAGHIEPTGTCMLPFHCSTTSLLGTPTCAIATDVSFVEPRGSGG
eukprot:scaffold100934_cov34-Tisochrysis_lutea.AAC.2